MAITKGQRIEGKGVERVGKVVRGLFFLVLASPLLFLLSPQNKVSCGFKLFLLLHFGSAYTFQTIFTLLVS
jgi:hypothetical protein